MQQYRTKKRQHRIQISIVPITVSLVIASLWFSLRRCFSVPLLDTSEQRALASAFLTETSTSSDLSPSIVVQPRAFDAWPSDTPLPCYPAEPNWHTGAVQRSQADTGFLYLKPFKSASSTLAGVNLRISRNVARRQRVGEMCRARFSHGPQPFAAASMFSRRTVGKSFLWTVLREPTARVVSQFFHFQVSKRKLKPTEANFRRFLVKKDPHNKRDYYLQCLHPLQKFDRDKYDPVEAAQEILKEYDFIGITERLDESVVVLMILLNLKMGDILFLSSKAKGTYDAYGMNGKCTYIQPSFVSDGMQEALESKTWQNEVQYDQALYVAANQSLDLTIDRLGRENVEKELVRFQKAKQLIAERCEPTTVFPCDQNGQPHTDKDTDCLWKDSGCGTECLDSVATDLDLW
jgi:hypothetical protein